MKVKLTVNIKCTVQRKGHSYVPPRTELYFDAANPFEFIIRTHKDLDDESRESVEPWVLPVEMFQNLRTLRGHGASACIERAGITISVPKSLNAWRREVRIDLFIEEYGRLRTPTTLIIQWRHIKRFMHSINKLLKTDPTAKDDYIESAALKLLDHS